jgi:hypothetical protein
MTKLTLLDIGLCEDVRDAGLVHLHGLIELRELSLRGTKVTDAGLRHLKALTGLRKLDLRHTKVTEAGVQDLQKALPTLVIAR